MSYLQNPLDDVFDAFSRSEAGQKYWRDKLAEEARVEQERQTRERLYAELFKFGGEGTAAHHSDVIQGQHRDCFLMAALAALVQQHPNPDEWLGKMITVNGDGSYTVKFYEMTQAALPYNPLTGGPTPAVYTAKDVTVRDVLPKSAYSDEEGERWPAVIEKAYAQEYGGPGNQPFDNRDRLGEAMERMTGIPSQTHDPGTMTLQQLDGYMKSNHAVTVQTFDKVETGLPHERAADHPLYQPGGLTQLYPEGPSPTWGVGGPQYEHNNMLRPWHEYYVHGVDADSKTVVLHNVWDNGREEIKMPMDQFQGAFQAVRVNPIYQR